MDLTLTRVGATIAHFVFCMCEFGVFSEIKCIILNVSHSSSCENLKLAKSSIVCVCVLGEG